MKIIDLMEARRNPEMNPRQTVIQQLEEYRYREDVFVHFSDVPKLGINPQQPHNTPFGIYGYPVDYVIDGYYIFGGLKNSVPYAGDRRYLVVFEGDTRGMLNPERYDVKDLEEDVDKLKRFLTPEIVEKSLEEYEDGYARGLLLLLETIANNVAVAQPRNVWYTQILMLLGYRGILDDDGSGTIHTNEPNQAVFFPRAPNTKLLEIIQNFQSNR